MTARTRTRRRPASIPAARLMAEAERARANAYAPYSRFPVGAALLTGSGRVYHGCNAEISSFGLSMCAERTAAWKAVSEGERDFVAVAVTAGRGRAASPCGACRQVLHEFGPGMVVLWRGPGGRLMRRTLDRLLADAFSFADSGAPGSRRTRGKVKR